MVCNKNNAHMHTHTLYGHSYTSCVEGNTAHNPRPNPTVSQAREGVARTPGAFPSNSARFVFTSLNEPHQHTSSSPLGGCLYWTVTSSNPWDIVINSFSRNTKHQPLIPHSVKFTAPTVSHVKGHVSVTHRALPWLHSPLLWSVPPSHRAHVHWGTSCGLHLELYTLFLSTGLFPLSNGWKTNNSREHSTRDLSRENSFLESSNHISLIYTPPVPSTELSPEQAC